MENVESATKNEICNSLRCVLSEGDIKAAAVTQERIIISQAVNYMNENFRVTLGMSKAAARLGGSVGQGFGGEVQSRRSVTPRRGRKEMSFLLASILLYWFHVSRSRGRSYPSLVFYAPSFCLYLSPIHRKTYN